MPKKRSFNRYTKPPSTAPATLSSSSTSNSGEPQQQGVNDILADLRRLRSPSSTLRPVLTATASLPPQLSRILQIPETPPPLPRQRNGRFSAAGRRMPPGPPPPRSWTQPKRNARPTHLSGSLVNRSIQAMTYLPGAPLADSRSLVDIVIRKMAQEWPIFREYDDLALHTLPTYIREALITALVAYQKDAIVLNDLRLLLVGPLPHGGQDVGEDQGPDNENFSVLHVPPNLVAASHLPNLSSMLFPADKSNQAQELAVQDSWDATDSIAPPLQLALLPNLTHLSLALSFSPGSMPPHDRLWSAQTDPSWTHLLALSKKLTALTHLSLAFWPPPTRTPNSRFSSVASPQGRSVQYGGTGMYSHSLDNDWVEAVSILRSLSRNLYKLEFLDLTGCTAWYPALTRGLEVASFDATGDGGNETGIANNTHNFSNTNAHSSAYALDNVTAEVDGVNWVTDWGKITTLRMKAGFRLSSSTPISYQEVYCEGIRMADSLERIVTGRRAGKGRFLNVEKDDEGGTALYL